VLTREPGGTEVCEKIRDIILDKDHFGMNKMCEALLYAASRAEHVEKVIKPALNKGKIVICDRFIHSSIAYQGYGRGLGKDVVAAINDKAVEGIYPDMTFFMMLPANNVHNRIEQSGKEQDRLEKEGVDFFERISIGYNELAKNEKKGTILNAKDSIESISSTINRVVDNIIENMS
jgi:dTMP kinase